MLSVRRRLIAAAIPSHWRRSSPPARLTYGGIAGVYSWQLEGGVSREKKADDWKCCFEPACSSAGTLWHGAGPVLQNGGAVHVEAAVQHEVLLPVRLYGGADPWVASCRYLWTHDPFRGLRDTGSSIRLARDVAAA